MNLYKVKEVKYLKNTHFLCSIFLIILIFTFIGSVSAIEADMAVSKINSTNDIDLMDSDSNFLSEETFTSENIVCSDDIDELALIDTSKYKSKNQLLANGEKNQLSANSAYKISSSSTNDVR